MYACMCADVVSEVYVGGGVIMQLLTSHVWKMLLCFSCCWDVTRLSNSHLGDVKGKKMLYIPSHGCPCNAQHRISLKI